MKKGLDINCVIGAVALVRKDASQNEWPKTIAALVNKKTTPNARLR